MIPIFPKKNNAANEPLALPEIGSVELAIIKPIFELLVKNNELALEEKINLVFKHLNEQNFSVEMLIKILNSANCLNCETLLEGCAKTVAYNVIAQFKIMNIEQMKAWCFQFDLPVELSVLIGHHMAQRYGMTQQCVLPACIQEVLKNTTISSYVLSADKALLAVALNNCSDIKVYNIKEGIVSSLPSRSRVKALCFSPNNAKLAVASDDNVVRIWNLGTEKCNRLSAEEGLESVAFSLDGLHVVATSHKRNKWIIQDWNLISLRCKSYRSNCKCSVKFDVNGEIVLDKKIQYKTIIGRLHLVNPMLHDEIMSLPIEGILLIRWALEFIGNGQKIDLNASPEIAEIYTNLILNQKPALTSFLQNHVALEKSYCAIS